jgi:energy-coupling factor transporter ATP-binding protein EcfA2
MKLEKLSYTEFEDLPNEWSVIDCTFGQINLIVGRNATGKTRMLNVMRGIVGLISESNALEIAEGKYSIELPHEGKLFTYSLEHHNKVVFFEELKIDNEVYLTRSEDGTGVIKAMQIGLDIRFKVETDRLAVVAKRDSIQHPYIDDLYKWAQGVTKLDFGSALGKGLLVIKTEVDLKEKLSIRDIEKVVGLFIQGREKFGDEYKDAVIADMKIIGYDLDDLGVDRLDNVSIVTPKASSSFLTSIPSPSGLYVKEADLQARTTQLTMSQGMFRALAVFIQFNYGLFSNEMSCLLIDDIGEGLDFGRSSLLVKRLIARTERSSVQLIMTTNDRFIMNAVPLEYWLILSRDGGQVTSLNYRNSKEMFDDFESTGLSNFDLFSSGYYKKQKQ